MTIRILVSNSLATISSFLLIKNNIIITKSVRLFGNIVWIITLIRVDVEETTKWETNK